MYSAKVLCDSISPDNIRLTTLEITYPRVIHSEFMTHRVFSRNSASSRAIPVEKQINKLLTGPFIPQYWGKNQRGMQAKEELSPAYKEIAIDQWNAAMNDAIEHARALHRIDAHKQLVNRLLEPFLWHTVIVSGTEWSNWNGLRRHEDAQPEIKSIADLAFNVMEDSIPLELDYGQWHMPLVSDYNDLKAANFTEEQIRQISVGRCCRISYLTHDGKRDPNDDVRLQGDLRTNGHMSPFEHPARPMTQKEIQLHSSPYHLAKVGGPPFLGNYRGWVSFRKELPFEDDYSKLMQKTIADDLTTEYLNDR